VVKFGEVCPKCGHVHNFYTVKKLWKKHSFGRIYFRSLSPKMFWDTVEAKIQVRSGTARTFYDSSEAIIHDILNIDDD
jgi:hypothetical protein